MSIVGPRPLVDKTFAPYSDEVKAKIYNVKPGLTGIGSILFHLENQFTERIIHYLLPSVAYSAEVGES